MPTKSVWIPTHPFERRIPKVCIPFVLNAGYRNVPDAKKEDWLKARFFLPAGWPICGKYARIVKLNRVRKVCWRAIRSYAARDIGDRRDSVGRPGVRQVRDGALYQLLHTTNDLSKQWQWPLMDLAAYHDTLLPEECFWLVARPSVLETNTVRRLALALARAVAPDTQEYTKAFQVLEQRIFSSVSTWNTSREIGYVLRTCKETRVVETIKSAAAADPIVALRFVLNKAAQLMEDRGETDVLVHLREAMADCFSREL